MCATTMKNDRPMNRARMNNTPDLQAILDTALGQKVLDAIAFPIVITVPSAAALIEGAFEEAEILDVQEAAAGTAEEAPVPEIGEQFDNELTRTIEEWRQLGSEAPAVSAEERQVIDALAQGGIRPSRTDDGVRDALLFMLQRLGSIEVQWVKVEISERPTLRLGDPIVLGNLVVRVQARIKACVRIIRNICVTVTTPRIRLEGRDLRLELSNRGAKLFATPQFSDLDIVITIRIFGRSFTIRIGITGIVNRALRSQAFELVDLSALEHDVPFSSAKVTIQSITPAQDANGLLLACEANVG